MTTADDEGGCPRYVKVPARPSKRRTGTGGDDAVRVGCLSHTRSRTRRGGTAACAPPLREVREAVSGHRRARHHAPDGDHREAAVLQLRQLVILQLGRVGGLQAEGVEGVIPGGAVEAVHVGQGGEGARLDEGDPSEDLDHRLREGVVRVNDAGDGLEGVRLAGDADELRNDESERRQHGHPAVLQLRLAEPREPLGGPLSSSRRLGGSLFGVWAVWVGWYV